MVWFRSGSAEIQQTRILNYHQTTTRNCSSPSSNVVLLHLMQDPTMASFMLIDNAGRGRGGGVLSNRMTWKLVEGTYDNVAGL